MNVIKTTEIKPPFQALSIYQWMVPFLEKQALLFSDETMTQLSQDEFPTSLSQVCCFGWDLE